jgi:hypothetical protein
VSGHRRGGHGHREPGSEADAMTLLSRAVDMARRRLRYRIGAVLLVVAMLMAALVLVIILGSTGR